MTTEIGDLKSEIVFHGDVLNTAARVQGLCNSLGYDLLLTDAVTTGRTDGHALGEHSVKGREALVRLVGYFAADCGESLGNP